MDTDILTNLLNTFISVFTLGYGRILPDAQSLLSKFATMEIVLTAIWWGFDDGLKVEVELIKKIMQICFFIWVISNYQWFTQIIIKGFIATGDKAGGSTNSLLMNPSLIIDFGFATANPIFDHIHNYSIIAVNKIPDIIISGLSGLLILLAYYAIAIIVFITYLEFYIISVLGLILVPFGVFKHTAFISEKVFGAVIAYGIRLMVLAFILSVIEPVLTKNTLGNDPSFQQIWTVFLTALTIAGLSWHAPGVASGLMAGAPSLGLGTVLGTGLATAAGLAGIGSGLGLGRVAHAGVGAAQKGFTATKAAAGAAVSRAISGGGSVCGGVSGGGSAKVANSSPRGGSSGGSGGGSGGGGRDSSAMPSWASALMLAHNAIPPESHPGTGMSAPLRRD